MTIRVPAWLDGRLRPVEKMEVHRRGLRHKAVSVFVMRGGATLLQKRAAGKYHTPGLWANACCTHPAWGEDPAATAARRLREELGLGPLPLVWRERIEYRADVGAGLVEHEVVDLFAAEAPASCEPHPAPEEVAETRWVALHDLVQDIETRPERYTPWLRIYVRDHGSTIFGTVPAG